MNIFVLDNDAATAARMMCDKHVVKMILESCQLLSTAHHVLDGDVVMTKGKKREYKTYSNGNTNICRCTMINHPCTIWTRASRKNYLWLWKHAHALCKEYTRRYGKVHAMEKMLMDGLYNPPKNITKTSAITPFAQAMPDEYKDGDAVVAYRKYYLGEKTRFAKWQYSEEPEWFIAKDPYNMLYEPVPF
jgi:hypothetical protein